MTWLNVDFVPENRAAYVAMELGDRAFEHTQALIQMIGAANRFPEGSFERDKIMRTANSLAEAGPDRVAP